MFCSRRRKYLFFTVYQELNVTLTLSRDRQLKAVSLQSKKPNCTELQAVINKPQECALSLPVKRMHAYTAAPRKQAEWPEFVFLLKIRWIS